MNEISHVAEQIAGGDLTVNVRERSAHDRLMQAMAKMIEELTTTVSDIQKIA